MTFKFSIKGAKIGNLSHQLKISSEMVFLIQYGSANVTWDWLLESTHQSAAANLLVKLRAIQKNNKTEKITASIMLDEGVSYTIKDIEIDLDNNKLPTQIDPVCKLLMKELDNYFKVSKSPFIYISDDKTVVDCIKEISTVPNFQPKYKLVNFTIKEN